MPQEKLNSVWESIKVVLQKMHKKQQIPMIPWAKNLEMKLEDCYVDLTIKNKNNKNTKIVHLQEIFKTSKRNVFSRIYRKLRRLREKTPQPRILIEGPAGYGKSTLVRKLCYDHAKGEEYIRHFEVVILLRLRGLEETLEEMIINTLQLRDYSPNQVFETIKRNQNKVLFILDGLDELHQDKHNCIIPLLSSTQLPHATVIVTSRLGYIKIDNGESDRSPAYLGQCIDSRIEINGIRGNNRITLLKLYFKDFSSENCNSLLQVVENKFDLIDKSGKNLFDCPLFLLLLGIVAEKTGFHSLKSKTQLYKELFNFILQRMFVKQGQHERTADFFNFDESNLPVYVKLLTSFGLLAGETLKQGKCSFPEEKILAACDSDPTILKLGILTQNDGKIGQKLESWFEPLHLSFLEFSFAYSVWVCMVRSPHYLPVVNQGNIVNSLHLLCKHDLVIPFLFGLCAEQLPMLLSALTHDRCDWVNAAVTFCDYTELAADSKLQEDELGQALSSLVPIEYIVDSANKISNLLEKTLMNKVELSKIKHIILDLKFIGRPTPFKKGPLKLRPNMKDLKHAPSQKWDTFTTNQNIRINDCADKCCRFTIIICEAHIGQQLTWLSSFIVLNKLYSDKPIHKIDYWCCESQLAGTFDKITELIRQEKVNSVSFSSWKVDCIQCLEQWDEFLKCSNESKQLLAMSLDVRADKSMLVDLGGAKEKTWKMLELKGNIDVRVGPLLNPLNDLTKYLESFVRELPPCIQTLRIEPNLLTCCPLYVIVQQADLPRAQSIRELRITYVDKYLTQTCIWEYLRGLEVFAFGLSKHNSKDEQREQHVTASVFAIISHCRLLKRLEFWEYCTEEFIEKFLQSLRKEENSVINNQCESKQPTHHLDTLMLSPLISSENKILESPTVSLVKDLLWSGALQQLWVSSTKQNEGYAKKEFLELFSPAEGFTCELEHTSCKDNALWNWSPILNLSHSTENFSSMQYEESGYNYVNPESMYIYKITALEAK